MTIHEPTTMATDYVLVVVLVFLGVRLARVGVLSTRLWSIAFFATALAAAVGGTYHGFGDAIPARLTDTFWKTTLYAIGVASVCILSGAAIATLPRGNARRVVLAAAAVKFIVLAVWLAGHNAFRAVILDYVPSMVAVFVLMLLARGRVRGTVWVMAGIVVTLAAAVVQMSGLAIHRHFNHNDLYHVIQIGGFFLLYRGSSRFQT